MFHELCSSVTFFCFHKAFCPKAAWGGGSSFYFTGFSASWREVKAGASTERELELETMLPSLDCYLDTDLEELRKIALNLRMALNGLFNVHVCEGFS